MLSVDMIFGVTSVNKKYLRCLFRFVWEYLLHLFARKSAWRRDNSLDIFRADVLLFLSKSVN
jgi:hypothetical protein